MQRIFFVASAVAASLLSASPVFAHGSSAKVTGDEFVKLDSVALYSYKMSHDDAANRLADEGIGLYASGGCTDRYNSSCTSLEEINDTTVNTLIILRQASGCDMVVSGGTEVGHAGGTYSHFNGYKVDIPQNECLNDYIWNNFSYIGRRGDGAPMYRSAAGNLYANEYWANHWDITYY